MVNFINDARLQLDRRVRQFRRTWRTEGPIWISDRARAVLADRIKPKKNLRPVRTADVLAADLTDHSTAQILQDEGHGRLIINWVMLPPSPGSGGHTTIFRILRWLEHNGHLNRVYFYDPYSGDHEYYATIVRNYFGFNGEIENVDTKMKDAHAVFATSWPTAYPVYNSQTVGKKFYFVQDFEPYFHAVSTDSVLAENTYRMRFEAVTAGQWLSEKLQSEYGMAANHFDFGCDTNEYRREDGAVRKGIAFYARPAATRRAFELGVMALEILAKRRPDIDLHFYGDTIGRLPFRFSDHGKLNPAQLNALYNRCCAGLTLSLTNVSLVPHEMLAAGCIPVVNDAEHNRLVLANEFIRYAPPSPHSLAATLESIVDAEDLEENSINAAASVVSASWDRAGEQVENILRNSIFGSEM